MSAVGTDERPPCCDSTCVKAKMVRRYRALRASQNSPFCRDAKVRRKIKKELGSFATDVNYRCWPKRSPWSSGVLSHAGCINSILLPKGSLTY
jgi:hypothetical protein